MFQTPIVCVKRDAHGFSFIFKTECKSAKIKLTPATAVYMMVEISTYRQAWLTWTLQPDVGVGDSFRIFKNSQKNKQAKTIIKKAVII